MPLALYQNCSKNQLLNQEESADLSSTSDEYHQIHTDHGLPNIQKAETPGVDFKPILMDRLLLHSLFVDIFGDNAKLNSQMKTLISDKAVFGGICSIYDNFKGSSQPEKNCANSASASELGTTYHPQANVLRTGKINELCMSLVSDPKNLSYALSKISNSPIPENNSENIKKLFKLFYREKPDPHQGLIDSLSFILKKSNSDLNGWAQILTVTCVSSHWQVL